MNERRPYRCDGDDERGLVTLPIVIAPKSIASCVRQPGDLFILEGLEVEPDIARHFAIDEFKLGHVPIIQAGRFSCEILTGEGRWLLATPVLPGVILAIVVANLTDDAQPFRARFLGHYKPPVAYPPVAEK